MKRLVFFLVTLISFYLQGHSQARTVFEITSQAGLLFQGSGDFLTSALGGQMVFGKSDRFMINSRFLFSQGREAATTGDFHVFNAQNLDLGLRIVPVPRQIDWFFVDLNFSLRHFSQVVGSSYMKVIDANNAIQHGSSWFSPEFSEDTTVGMSTALNFRLFKKGYYLGGITGVIHGPYTNGDIASGILIYVGVDI